MRRRPMRRGRPVARRGRPVNKRRGSVKRRTRANRGRHGHNYTVPDHYHAVQANITQVGGYNAPMNYDHRHAVINYGNAAPGMTTTSGSIGWGGNWDGQSYSGTAGGGSHLHRGGGPTPMMGSRPGRGRRVNRNHPARRKPNKLRG